MIREAELVIVGDEAWLPEELAKHRAKAARKRERDNAYHRAYYAANRERIKERNRLWMARHRKPSMRVVKTPAPRLVGSLHSLACLGPTKATDCRCRKIRMYSGSR